VGQLTDVLIPSLLVPVQPLPVSLTMDEAQAVAGALRELIERSELNELILGQSTGMIFAPRAAS
jgi:hypothetical protein